MRWFGAMCLLWIYCVIDNHWLLTSVGLTQASSNKSYICKMNFYTIHFNIKITLYWASPNLYTCIVLSDIKSSWLNRILCIVYKIHEHHNDQLVERHKTQTQVEFSAIAFVKAAWYWKTISLNSSYFTSHYFIWIIWIKMTDQITSVYLYI